jgi:hypothetical protein
VLADLLSLGLVVAFFALAVVAVRACEAILGGREGGRRQ